MSDTGWQPLSAPPRRSGAEVLITTPFARLARTHALAVAGDTLITLALAGSLFFSIDPEAARSKVALYLALTMAPFAVVAPLIGPALDRARGGRRWVIVGANALRGLICLLMIRDLDSMLLFPEAFAVLVLAKSYHVAKSALVPTVVRSDEALVDANSRLSLLSGIVTFAAAIPGGILIALSDSRGALVLAVGVFAAAAIAALAIPATKVAVDETSETERQELRSGGIVLGASAMGLLRGIVGFLAFLLAFHLRSEGASPWQFGVVLATSGVGSLLGSLAAPPLRRSGMTEERILQFVLAITAVAGLIAAFAGGLVAAAGLALGVAIAAACGKLAFDSVVQRDAPDANRGRSFARFETRFQLTWVVGAFVPVVISIPVEIGFIAISAGAAFALVSYTAGVRALARGQLPERRSNPLTRRLPTWQGVGLAARDRLRPGGVDTDAGDETAPEPRPGGASPIRPRPVSDSGPPGPGGTPGPTDVSDDEAPADEAPADEPFEADDVDDAEAVQLRRTVVIDPTKLQ